MEKNVSELEKQRLQEFLAGFRTINMKLKEVFKMLTVQGQAELELVDSMDPFSDVRYSLGIQQALFPPEAKPVWFHWCSVDASPPTSNLN